MGEYPNCWCKKNQMAGAHPPGVGFGITAPAAFGGGVLTDPSEEKKKAVSKSAKDFEDLNKRCANHAFARDIAHKLMTRSKRDLDRITASSHTSAAGSSSGGGGGDSTVAAAAAAAASSNGSHSAADSGRLQSLRVLYQICEVLVEVRQVCSMACVKQFYMADTGSRRLFEFLFKELENSAEDVQEALEEAAGPGIGSVKALNAKLNTDLNGVTAPVAGAAQPQPALMFAAGPLHPMQNVGFGAGAGFGAAGNTASAKSKDGNKSARLNQTTVRLLRARLDNFLNAAASDFEDSASDATAALAAATKK